MTAIGRIVLRDSKRVFIEKAQWCKSFACKFAGLMFRRSLEPEFGLILVESRESRTATSIHMLFMQFPIAVIWLDAEFQVVDKVMAKPWRLAYVSRLPAQYVLEAHETKFDLIQIGDFVKFEAISR